MFCSLYLTQVKRQSRPCSGRTIKMRLGQDLIRTLPTFHGAWKKYPKLTFRPLHRA